MVSQENWPLVGLAFVNMLQVVALAWINNRGVILPPTNRRRTRHTDSPKKIRAE